MRFDAFRMEVIEIRWAGPANIHDLQTELQNIAENKEMACRQRILNVEQTKKGKNYAESFYLTKDIKSKKGIAKLVNAEGGEVTKDEEIQKILEQHYESTVGSDFTPEMSLTEFLEKYGVELPTLAEAEQNMLMEDVTDEEVKYALSSAKTSSAPGPSGQSIAIFKYLYSQVPKLMLATINQLIFVPGLIKSGAFAWLLERKIVFIPKPGKVPDRVQNLRPLSLLESMYKILTRILTGRMAGTLDSVLYTEQHGFRAGRGCQTAVLPVLEAVQDAESSGRPLQLLSIDVKAAFDTIDPKAIYEVMLKQGYPVIFADALHKITEIGVGRIFYKGLLGEKFLIKSGAGQGDPASAPRYTVGSDPSLRALQRATELVRYTFSHSGERMPVLAYADDQFKGLSVNTPQQITNIIQIYKDFAKVSGLQISIEKTAIMGINTCPDLLREIAEQTGIKVVTEIKYLGIEIRKTYAESMAASFDAVTERLGGKYDRISSSYVDLFHRRQLIQSVFAPSYNHVYMAFGYSEEAGNTIDNMICRLLWTRKNGGATQNKRKLVAKNRIAASYNMGGLKMSFSRENAQGLLLNTLQRLKAQADLPDQMRMCYSRIMLSRLRQVNALSINEMFSYAGCKIWTKYSKKLETKSPFLAQCFAAYANMICMNETNRESWSMTPIAGHTLASDFHRITEADGYLLAANNLTHVGQLFGENYFTGSIQMGEDAVLPQGLGENANFLKDKCRMLRRTLSNKNASCPQPLGSFYQVFQSKKWSRLNRELTRSKLDSTMPGPPSYFTRRKDGIPVPPLHKYMGGYDAIFKLNLSSKTMQISYECLNRTCWTNLKQNLTSIARGGEIDTPNCTLCGRTETTLHLMFECEKLAEPLWQLLAEIINADLRERGKQNNIVLHAYNVMYNLNIGGVEAAYGAQIQQLIQEIKRAMINKRYQRCITERAVEYGRRRLASNLIIVVKKLISLLRYQGKKKDTLEAIRDLLIKQL
jgi:hypothetical protein